MMAQMFLRQDPPKVKTESLLGECSVWAMIGIIATPFVLRANDRIIFFLADYRLPWLDTLSFLATEYIFWGSFALLILAALWRVWRNPDHHTRLLPAVYAGLLAFGLSAFFKETFDLPRPFQAYDLVSITAPASYGFPSGHTAVSFALMMPLWRISRTLGYVWGVWAAFVAFARVYELVHFPSDIVGGFLLGGWLGSILSHPSSARVLHKHWEDPEFRRQSLHMVCGMGALFLQVHGLLSPLFLMGLLLLGLGLSLAVRWRVWGFLTRVTALFDRAKDSALPGKGALCMVLGILFSVLLFPPAIVVACIVTLTFGDSLNHYFADHIPWGRLPWARHRTAYGMAIGALMSTAVGSFFVPWYFMLPSAVCGVLAEARPRAVQRFLPDDNILVPLVTGGVLWGLLTFWG